MPATKFNAEIDALIASLSAAKVKGDQALKMENVLRLQDAITDIDALLDEVAATSPAPI